MHRIKSSQGKRLAIGGSPVLLSTGLCYGEVKAKKSQEHKDEEEQIIWDSGSSSYPERLYQFDTTAHPQT